MNHDAGDPTTEENTLTPWESLDPSEPAAVALLAPPADDAEVAVYRAAELEEEPIVQAVRKPVRISLNVLAPSFLAGDSPVPSSNPASEEATVVESQQSSTEQPLPLTLTLSPEYRGEGTNARSVESVADPAPFDATPLVEDSAASFPLAPVIRGEGRGEGPDAPVPEHQQPSAVQPSPLTLTLSPGYRGEGTKPGNAEVISDSKPCVVDDDDADTKEAAISDESVDQLFAQAIAEADIPSDDYEEPREESEAAWEDPEMGEEPEPAVTGASWTIPLLCAGIAIIACCIVIPQADANHRLAYEKRMLQADMESVQKQVAVNDEFLKKVVDDPSLAERLAQRQLKRVRKGQRVLHLKEETPEMSPFQITNVAPPPPPPPYKPVGGMIASLCYDARVRLYLMGSAMVMMACALVMGSTPGRK